MGGVHADMDLTKTYPRSVRDKVHGLVQIGRAIDKGYALAFGNIGEYNFDCPMDKAVFAFLGIDAEKLLERIKQTKSVAEIEAYVSEEFISKKSPAEIEQWNQQWLSRSPEGESLGYFVGLRDEIAPDRTDVTTWADLLDLDEKRAVPKREIAKA